MSNLLKLKCTDCKKIFYRISTQPSGNKVFCSSNCYYNFLKVNSYHSSLKIRKIREKVFKRDNYKCSKCNRSNITLNIHHLDGSNDGYWEDANNKINNLITLCIYCHSEAHKGENITRKRIKKIIELRNKGLKLKQIGDIFNVSGERVRQIILNAL
jgi:hypothetical protein